MDPSRTDTFYHYQNPKAPYLQFTSPTFGLADREIIEQSFVAASRRLRIQLLRFITSRSKGNLSIQGFVSKTRIAIYRAYFEVYALGAISIFPFYTLTDRDVRILDDELNAETGFLREFARDLGGNRLLLDPISRAGLYLLALRGIFEKGRTEAMPPGPYKWKLGDTEHCVPCINASMSGPYQRERYSGLGLPELPGNPGDGSVCLGLTRCGCTVILTTGPLPNQDLPERIRELLWEVAYGTSPTTSEAGTE